MPPLFPALFPALAEGSARPALRFGDRTLTYAELATAAGGLAARITGAPRIAVWATPTAGTVVGVLAALLAGVPVVPVNPGSGERELEHIISDSAPALVVVESGTELPRTLDGLDRVHAETSGPPVVLPAGHAPGAPALIVYTSGTTGPPKGVVLPRRAIAANLDALAEAWQWTADDVLVHALPLFHVHGLILGMLGPLRRGGSVRHLGRFDTGAVARELSSGATMFFGVPTMYHRIAEALPGDPALVKALAGARLLVSGSAALPVGDHRRITDLTGRQVIERYGMTETLMNTSVRVDGVPRPGTVGVPLHGVELRLVDDAGSPIVPDGSTVDGRIVPDGGAMADGVLVGGSRPAADRTVGEVEVRGPNLFTEYLNRPDATEEAFHDGWFRTGDVATRDPDGYVRIVGRMSTDLIKSGGYKIGAGEIENVLLDHPGVSEVAVTGEPDADLGERVVAWIVPADPASPPSAAELAGHVAAQLAAHKRPRTVRYLDSLPRNDMGKVMKRALHA